MDLDDVEESLLRKLAAGLFAGNGHRCSKEGPARNDSNSCLALVIPKFWLRNCRIRGHLGSSWGLQARRAHRVRIFIHDFHLSASNLSSNPKDYNDNEDARVYDARLRGPVRPIELQIDPDTGMKNYIANGKGDWATSAAFVKYSFERSIHHGRLYTNGHTLSKGKDDDLAEALRCLGQGLHTLEDFGAHTNYVELSLRELGFNDVFCHTGFNTMIHLRNKHVYPLVTGTFGMVDFYHSVLGEATDHFTQSEVNEMDNALGTAQTAAHSSSPITTLIKLLSKVPGTRDLCIEAEQLQRACDARALDNQQASQNNWGGQQQSWGGNRGAGDHIGGTGGLGGYAQSRVPQPDWSGPEVVVPQHQTDYNQQPQWNQYAQSNSNQPDPQWIQQLQHPPPSDLNQQHMPPSNQSSTQVFNPAETQKLDQSQAPISSLQQTPSQPQQTPVSAPGPGLPGMPNFDPAQTIRQIYPILAFRDKVVRSISAIIEKIPGLEALVDRITETLTVFILSLLAPFVRPVINGITISLQAGSSGVVGASANHQFEPWTDPSCTDPTHSLLSKDHFTNVLNPPAGAVAAEILKYVAPRVLYAWQNSNVPVDHVLDDCMKVFHHPAIRDNSLEVHRNMFGAVEKWIQSRPDRGNGLNAILSSESVRNGKNQKGGHDHTGHTHNSMPSFGDMGFPGAGFAGSGSQQQHHIPFGGWGGHQQQQPHTGGGFDALAQLSSLPIPGVQNLTSKINKFSSFIPGGFGGSSRGIDDDAGKSRGLESDFASSGTTEGEPTPPFMPPSGYEVYESGGHDRYY